MSYFRSFFAPLALASLVALLGGLPPLRAGGHRGDPATPSPAPATRPLPPLRLPRRPPPAGSARRDLRISPRQSPSADLPRDRPLRAGVLVVDGVYNTELIAPFDVFQHTQFHTQPNPGMEVVTISPTASR